MTGAKCAYPTIATNLEGDEVFVVTAFPWSGYLGYIDVEYDQRGKIVSYGGAPTHLTNATEGSRSYISSSVCRKTPRADHLEGAG